MEDPFKTPTYVCLDLSAPMAQRVLAIRRGQRDAFRSALPAEITVAGSGGVGVFSPGQSSERVFDILEDIAARTRPLEARFGPVMRFERSDVFAFSLAPTSGFLALHERIARSGIRFEPVPFPFQPHCTLRSRSPVTEEESAELLAIELNEAFVLESLSVYSLERPPAVSRFQTRLRGES